MFCSFSMTKPIVANANLPQNPDSSSSSSSTPQQLNLPQNQKPSSLAPTNRLRRLRPPQPSITQLERAVGAGSFRDGEPELKMNKDSDIKKTVLDLFLGQAMEGAMQKKLRETGEWLGDNGETRLQSSSSSIGDECYEKMV
ncbi:uncharacterized protein [Cicer arietinum]|uniref:Uncharacterized protein LOC101495006 isoform X2 n=1 Tax=Cicer arietinum TaxID=3827 RepID=A0A3Q7XPL8_CICAR|nr:uncharacterized protein LOC101495006 isoform X2 [Cicer arietinum]